MRRIRPALLILLLSVVSVPVAGRGDGDGAAGAQAPATQAPAPAATRAGVAQTRGIRLVLLIAVDQLRQDYLWRFRADHTDGLRRLMTHGAVFTNASLEHSPTVTAVGHATMLTGAPPSMSGIIGNEWFDRETGRNIESITDPSVRAVGGEKGAASPRRLQVTTLGDELKLAAGPGTPESRMPKVIGISEKDRAAILPGGRGADAAYWLPTPRGPFVTSTYYREQLPAWVAAVNASGRGMEPEPSVNTNGRVIALAIEALAAERLGQREATDVLTVSLSDNDEIGHAMGPHAPEVREVTRTTDRRLGDLLRAVDQRVGLARTLVVLTADHGVAPTPETMAALRLPGGRTTSAPLREAIEAALSARFGPGRWVLSAVNGVYLDHRLITARALDAERVRLVAAEAAMAVPHVARVYTRDQLQRGQVPPDMVGRRVLRGFHPQRSGDLEVVLEPFWMRRPEASGTTHGAPYTYDAHVPLIVMGPGIAAGTYRQSVALNDLAPTLAALLEVEPPSGADGRVLTEIIRPR